MKSLELALYVTVCLSGLILTAQDVKSQSVTLFPLGSFFASCVCIGILNSNFAFIPIVVFTVIGVAFYVWKKSIAFGAADYIVVCANSFLICDVQSPFFIILCGIFGILFSIILHQDKIPFIPAMLLSTLVVLTLRRIFTCALI